MTKSRENSHEVMYTLKKEAIWTQILDFHRLHLARAFLDRCESRMYYCFCANVSEWIKNVSIKCFHIPAEFGAMQTAAEGQIFCTISALLRFQILCKL